MSRKSNTRSVFIAAVFVGLAALLIIFGREQVSQFVSLISDQERVSSFARGYGYLTPLILAMLQFIQIIIAFLPGYAVAIAAGYIYGMPTGFLFNLGVTVLASQLAFWIARRYGRPVVFRLARSEIIERLDGAAKKYGFSFFLIGILLPVVPADMMNYLGGLSGISGRAFLGASIIGRIPSIFWMTWLGAYGSKLADLNLSTRTWVFSILGVVILYVLVTYFARRIASTMDYDNGKE